MIIPSEVKVWMRTFKVEEVDQEGFKTKARAGDFLEGEVWWAGRTIHILKDLEPGEKGVTFFHELTHIADELAGSQLSEAKIKGVSQILYFILEENNLLAEPQKDIKK